MPSLRLNNKTVGTHDNWRVTPGTPAAYPRLIAYPGTAVRQAVYPRPFGPEVTARGWLDAATPSGLHNDAEDLRALAQGPVSLDLGSVSYDGLVLVGVALGELQAWLPFTGGAWHVRCSCSLSFSSLGEDR